jgi:asparagine synthase (glutamine-hydrolysing)
LIREATMTLLPSLPTGLVRLRRRERRAPIGLGDRRKIDGGDTKRVLRGATAGILSELVRNRRDKLGFATPEEDWFRSPLREAVLGGIEQTLSYFPRLLNGGGVRAHAADMLERRRGVDFSLWRIANLGISAACSG